MTYCVHGWTKGMTQSGVTDDDLRELAGGVVVVGLDSATSIDEHVLQRLRDLRPAGVLLLRRNVATSVQIAALTSAMKEGLRDGLLVATDEEGGRVSAFGRVLSPLPAARQLGTEALDVVRLQALHLGRALARFGVDWNYSPVADLDASDADGPIGDRSFSADPKKAKANAVAVWVGLKEAGVLGCAKHFPGQGRATADTHGQEAVIDTPLQVLRSTDIEPFAALIKAGIPSVMVSHAIYSDLDPGLPASLSPTTYVLLRQLGFSGVAITDSLAMSAITDRFDPADAAVRAVAAGADAVLTSQLGDGARIRDALVTAVRQGRLSRVRLYDAATRVQAMAQKPKRSQN